MFKRYISVILASLLFSSIIVNAEETETSYNKLNAYSSQAVDPQIKQMFSKAAQDSLNTKQKLMGFLN